MKKILFFVSMLLVLLIPLPGNSAGYYGGGGVSTDTNCDQAKYHGLGRLCQDSDDGKLYKGTGSSVLEVAAGASTGDVTGPSSSTDFEVAVFSGTGGKTLKRSNDFTGLAKLTEGVLSTVSLGTLTNGYICTYSTTSGIQCTTAPTTYLSTYPSAGIVKSTGSAWTTAATYSDVVGLWTACNDGYLKYDGTCATPAGGEGTGDVATDTIWDAKGDLAVASGANTAAKLAIGTAYQILHVNTDTPGWTSTLGATGTRLTKIWATDLELTNAPTIGGAEWTTILQPLDAELTALAGLTSGANAIPYFTGSGTAWVISSSANMVSLLESEDYATALSNLGGQASDSALTTLSSKTFSKTALTGTGGLDTVLYDDLDDGDIGMVGTVAGVIYWYVFEASSATAESSPSVITPDDAGENNGRWLLKLYCDGSSCTVPQASTGSYQTLLEGSAGGTNFRRVSVPNALTADLNLQHPDALPAANQFQLFPEPTAGVSAYTWTTYGAFSALPISTTGTISGGTLTPVIDDPDNFAANFTGANLYGGTFIANAAGTAALPAAAVGMNFTVVLEGANAVILNPDGTGTADTIVMNGLAAAQDENITSSTSGAMCVFQYRAADSWMATCNGFAEATP